MELLRVTEQSDQQNLIETSCKEISFIDDC